MKSRTKVYSGSAIACFVLLIAGCSPRYYEESADKEVSGIIDEKKELIADDILPADVLRKSDTSETILLGLEDAVMLAFANNRDYIAEAERIYLDVLSLTYERYLFSTRHSVGGRFGWRGGGDTDDVFFGEAGYGIVQWLATGARIGLDISKDFLAYLTGDRDTDMRTIVSLNLVQPLLRGAGRRIATENLIQAERDAVYSIRSFLRYRRRFSVDIAENYLHILRLGNMKKNFYNNYESLRRTRERVEMLAEAGRMPAAQVDQARQNEYNAHQRWINAVNSYNTALARFKIHLGLEPFVEISLDDTLLEQFIKAGIDDIDVEPEDFTVHALRKRLDLITQYDRLEDARRKAEVARDNLRSSLGLRTGIGIRSSGDAFPSLDFGEPSYSVEMDFTLPADRFSERNQYKRALIALQRAERDFQGKVDNVNLEISQQYRNLEEAYQSYLIQRGSLELARQRIESINLLLEAGRATIRDLLEAEDAYLEAQNTLSAQIVNYKIAYLRFLYMTEYLEVDAQGVWEGDLYERITEKSSQK